MAKRDIPGRTQGASCRRLERERLTVDTMILMYCRGVHGTADSLCPDCAELQDYARRKLDRCVFGEDKPTCALCPVHCYGTAMRESIRCVMRYAGPRMIWRHPLMALLHLVDSRRVGGR